MKRPQKDDFQTHIPEPRWQQVVSVIIVVIAAVLQLFILFKVF